MRRVSKRIIGLLTALVLVLTCTAGILPTAAAEDTDGLDRSAEMLKAFGILPNINKKYGETIKRDELAYLIESILTGEAEAGESGTSGGSGTSGSSDKYTGFTNDIKKDDWVWEGADSEEESAAPETLKELTNTPFYDLRDTDDYCESIRTLYNMGIMCGSDGYYRPKERVTGYELVKVMVILLGGGKFAEGGFPTGYITAAQRTGLLQKLNIGDLNDFVTYGNYIKAIETMIESRSYKFSNGVFGEYEISENTFREDFLCISKVRGVMTTNGVSSVSGEMSIQESYVSIGDRYIKKPTSVYDGLLGLKVDAYYSENNDGDNEIKYICRGNNRELVIDAENISGYSRPYYTYYEGNNTKKVYCGSDTTVMYNGYLCEDYVTEDMVPTTGSVRLVDNDSDGTYDIAFVTNYTTLWVSINDSVNHVIHSNLDKEKIILDDYDTVTVYNSSGGTVEAEVIKRNDVLFAMPTKSTQTERKITIYINDYVVEGAVKNIKKDTIKVEDETYSLSAYAKDRKNELKLDKSYIFYFDPDGKVVVWEEKTDDGLKYGYMSKIGQQSGMDVSIVARIFDFTENKLINFAFADKVSVNDVKVKEEELLKSDVTAYLYDKSSGAAIMQVVRYKLNANKEITQIYTPDVVKDKLVTVYEKDDEFRVTYRDINGSFNSNKPLFYGSHKSTFWVNVPKADANATSAYYTTTFKHDDKVYLCAAYGTDETSLEADVLIRKTDTSASKTVTNVEADVLMITDIGSTVIDEDIYTSFSGATWKGDKEYYLEPGSDVADTSDYKIGDIIRVTADKDKRITSVERVYDCEEGMLCSGTGMYGTNPLCTSSDMAFISRSHLVHGVVEKMFDKGKYMRVRPYVYDSDDAGNRIKGEATGETYDLKSSMYTVYIMDLERNTVTKTTAEAAITDAESAKDGEGTELVVYNVWGTPEVIYMYKK